ncbi:MAG: hypothetical protein QF449_16510 [Alphaproteobacteria bacterium]|nr:hypothetical protein [Alphaproteobacteria bacterium]
MKSNYDLAKIIFSDRKKTLNALSKFVMTMADVANLYSGNKQPSKSKEKKRYSKMDKSMGKVFSSLIEDGVASTPPNEIELLDRLDCELSNFKKCFPNWPDAYGFWNAYYHDRMEILRSNNTK